VLENQRLLALDISLKAKPARWWGAHKETIQEWLSVNGYFLLDLAWNKGEIKCIGMMDKEH
jgi:hypothetical protein